MEVANGFDSLLWFRFNDSPYGAHFWHEIGADCMDYENNDLPWRQFCYGAWYGANCERAYADSRPLRFVRRRLGRQAALKIVQAALLPPRGKHRARPVRLPRRPRPTCRVRPAALMPTARRCRTCACSST